MPTVPKRVSERLASGLKRFQPILNNAKSRDDGEADTVTIIVDMLAEIFGYDKYVEVTAEYAIRSTYCDLAIKMDGTIQTLIEVKAIGLDLKDNHVKQAIDYAANQGVDWVILTNGIHWRIYKVTFGKPINSELVVDLNICELNPRNAKHLELLYLWCKEGWVKSGLGDYYEQRQSLSRFYLGNICLTDPVLKIVRQEIRKLFPDVKVDIEEIKNVLVTEVIKREVFEGEKAVQAQNKINRVQNKINKEKELAKSQTITPAPLNSPVSESSGEAA